MRLTTWNCKGAFARKQTAIAGLRPDVVVVPESECLESQPNMKWVGETRNKGLGVIAYGDYSLRIHDAYEPRHRWILPLEVDGPEPFVLFAVWTVPHRETRYYVTCLFEALETYRELLNEPRVVWAGDFNQSTI